jgi:hypothetical protein
LDSFLIWLDPRRRQLYVNANESARGAVPKQYKDAASTAIRQGQVTCPQGNGGAPFPNPLFGTPRTMFNPRQLQFQAKFSF